MVPQRNKPKELKKETIYTADQQRIALAHYLSGHKKVIVLVHGFFNHKDMHLFREIAQQLNEHYDVLAFDLRGHGQSSGFFTWTAKERADLKAVLQYLESFKYETTGLMGFSLGGAICLIEAANNQDIQTVIAISAPYDFWQIDFRFWKKGMREDLKFNLGHTGRGKRVLAGHLFGKKVPPLKIVDRISPRSVLFIHGSEDWLIDVRHSRELYQKSKEPKKLEIIQNGGHAEMLFNSQPQEFMGIVLKWFESNL